MQANSATTNINTVTGSSAKTEARAGIFMAAMLGVALIWGVGFSHINTFHNAAHDTRHSNAFPCH